MVERAGGLQGLGAVERCVFETTYPFGRVVLSDESAPFDAVVEAWSPFIPGDEESSGLPVAALRVRLQSTCAVPLNATVMLSLEDIVGHRLRVPGLTAGSSRAAE